MDLLKGIKIMYNANLPSVCAAFHPNDGYPIVIRRDEMGYFPAHGLDVVACNRSKGITAQQVEAMLTGSMFGWYVRGANPNNCSGDMTMDCV